MKNLILYVAEEKAALRAVRPHLDLQVENSLELGWRPEDILLYTNFPYALNGVRAIELDPPPRPVNADIRAFYKTYCMLAALERLEDDEVGWYHDIDAYQLLPFPEVPSRKRLAFCLYATSGRLLIQAGSIFLRKASRPVFEYAFDLIHAGRCTDEVALTEAFSRPEFLGWFETIDYSYNLGNTDYALRYQLAQGPTKVLHFHLRMPEHRAKMIDGENPFGQRLLDERFMALVRKHGFDDPPPIG